MRIAQVCPDYHPYIGGVQTLVKETSEILVKKGFLIEVLTTDRSGRLPAEEQLNGVKVRRFRSWEGLGRTPTSGAYYFSRDLQNYLSDHSGSYDVVHAHHYAGFPALYAARSKADNSFILHPHYHERGHTFLANLLRIPWKLVAGKMYEKADRILCSSEYERCLVLRNFDVESRRVSVLVPGIKKDEFGGIAKRGDSQTVLYVGRLERYKGIEYMIKALAKLDSGMRLDINGKGPDKDRLVGLARKLHVEDRVEFDSPARDELLRKYAEAAIFVLLSRYEAYSFAVAEALASGTPCIVANSSALREWVDNRNCFGIDYPIDIDKLASMMRSVIGTKVSGVILRDWEDVAQQLSMIYLGRHDDSAII